MWDQTDHLQHGMTVDLKFTWSDYGKVWNEAKVTAHFSPDISIVFSLKQAVFVKR